MEPNRFLEIVHTFQNDIRPCMAFTSKTTQMSAQEFFARELCTQLTLMFQLTPQLKEKFKCVEWTYQNDTWGIQWHHSSTYSSYVLLFSDKSQTIRKVTHDMLKTEYQDVATMSINCSAFDDQCYAYFKPEYRWAQLVQCAWDIYHLIKTLE